ncbi:pyridoxamine 5'-phosphate oxidase family protein [Paenarthrobacter sp. PH39-S1]|uniref:pyridoxamine 5'-phosphate oxidase family protein n=1 Tax=Paenarthrobacter sp. PH39-S1 TaxID=3046204 RepID=UPI0024B96CEE|nr:pyridoxamine 5'-phosphate oxidase family protein [Paenarthrobacter sp. PH39-S1]MDJ0355905.1 pyridoxamine 5'-phosphate oxidase family protein [Paenarthrobacter sp. PH39-S1]
MAENEEIRRIIDIVNKSKIGMFTTVDKVGTPISRPMTVQQTADDADLWFLTDKDTSVVAELELSNKVNVSFGHGTDWVSVSGTAKTLQDTAKVRELWSQANTAFFPDGPETPGLTLIHVDSDSAEYWETPGGVASVAFRWAKARVTGKQINAGDSHVVEL